MTSLLGKRIALGVAAVGATAALVAATSYAVFSAAAPAQSTQFQTGTVTFNGSASDTSALTFGNGGVGIAPGDTVSPTKAYVVSYSGSLPAWITLGVQTQSTAQNNGNASTGFLPLINDGQKDPNGLRLNITDSPASNVTSRTNTFHVGYVTCTYQTGAVQSTCTSNNPNQLVGNLQLSSGNTDTFNIGYSLPGAAGNGYEGALPANTTVTLTAHAYSASNTVYTGAATTPAVATTNTIDDPACKSKGTPTSACVGVENVNLPLTSTHGGRAAILADGQMLYSDSGTWVQAGVPLPGQATTGTINGTYAEQMTAQCVSGATTPGTCNATVISGQLEMASSQGNIIQKFYYNSVTDITWSVAQTGTGIFSGLTGLYGQAFPPMP